MSKKYSKRFYLVFRYHFIDLSLKTILIEEILENKDTLKDNSFKIQKYINLIKDEEIKYILSKLLCDENKRLSLDELILEKKFLSKVAELDLFKKLINSEKELIISTNDFPFFFSCNSCKIIPNILLLDNQEILFRCPKCHICKKRKNAFYKKT